MYVLQYNINTDQQFCPVASQITDRNPRPETTTHVCIYVDVVCLSVAGFRKKSVEISQLVWANYHNRLKIVICNFFFH